MKGLYIAIVAAAMTSTAGADEFRPAMEAYYESALQAWVNDPVLVAAIMEQNARTADLDMDAINALDQAWRAVVGTGGSPMMTEVLDNPAADFLRSRVAESGGAITEAFAMDALGLNVAATAPTSDYWQGDEAKYQETYPIGPGTIHFSEIEFDESTQTYQGQISAVIVDPASNTPIGAITIGVNAEALM